MRWPPAAAVATATFGTEPNPRTGTFTVTAGGTPVTFTYQLINE